MGQERLQTLREMLADEPGDPFTRYALAMELKGLGEGAAALSEFDALLGQSPEYLASYYHFGALLHAEGQTDRALEVIRAGIERAGQAGEAHAQSELEDLLDEVDG